MIDLILKKRSGFELDKKEIDFMISEYSKDNIPDYQMSSMLMAIYFKGMTDTELTNLTNAIANSGKIIDLSQIDGIKVDKHSTGGVGDKTTLIISSIVASFGVKVAKMSGRALGHTGGTIDKMESIPNLKTNLTKTQFFDIVNKVGISVIGQTDDLAPADKKLYALRDVTGTVDSIPLIASSVMSKKLAAGSDCILLDVKTGSGAFMKNLKDSILLAKKMVAIGENSNKKTIALITDMDTPLGNNVGNLLEIKEVIETLNGNGPDDLTELCVILASNMLYLAGKGNIEKCEQMAKEAIFNKKALAKFIEMVEAQGGDSSYIKNPSKFEMPKFKKQILAQKTGFITKINAESCGIAATILGAGRESKESKIDYLAGLVFNKKCTQFVNKGDVILTLYSSNENKFEDAQKILEEAIFIDDTNICPKPLVFAKIEKNYIKEYI